jgi:hypothetical protein
MHDARGRGEPLREDASHVPELGVAHRKDDEIDTPVAGSRRVELAPRDELDGHARSSERSRERAPHLPCPDDRDACESAARASGHARTGA